MSMMAVDGDNVMGWFKRTLDKIVGDEYVSPLDPIIKAHDAGELSDEAYRDALGRSDPSKIKAVARIVA